FALFRPSPFSLFRPSPFLTLPPHPFPLFHPSPFLLLSLPVSLPVWSRPLSLYCVAHKGAVSVFHGDLHTHTQTETHTGRHRHRHTHTHSHAHNLICNVLVDGNKGVALCLSLRWLFLLAKNGYFYCLQKLPLGLSVCLFLVRFQQSVE